MLGRGLGAWRFGVGVLWLALWASLWGCEEGGGEGGGGGGGGVEAPKILVFEADPEEVVRGAQSTLRWEVDGATDVSVVSLVGGEERFEQVIRDGEVQEGSLSVTPQETTTYRLLARAKNAQGEVSEPDSAELVVSVTDAPARPRVVLRVAPSAVFVGERATVSWEVEEADSLALTANGVGVDLPRDVPLEGSLEVMPNVSTEYELTATGPGGQASSLVSLVVRQPARVVSFEASPARVRAGEPVVLAWETEGAARVEIEAEGELLDLSGRDPAGDEVEVTPTASTTWTLTAFGEGDQAEAVASVEVLAAPQIVAFGVEPGLIPRGGAARLRWETRDASEVEVYEGESPLGVEGLEAGQGELVVSPQQSVGYRLVARGEGGEVDAEVNLEVVEPVEVVSFGVEPGEIELGERASLRWEVRGATALMIVDADGQEVEGPLDLAQGEAEVSPASSTRYTLMASGPGGADSAEVELLVDGTVRAILGLEPEEVDEGGTARLSWQTLSASRIELEARPGPAPDIEGLPVASGGVDVAPTQTTTYTMIAYDDEGNEAQDEVTLTVRPAVVVERFEVSSTEVFVGDEVTVSWATRHAARVYLKVGDAPDAEVEAAGSRSFALEQDERFVLRAEGVGGPVERALEVEVSEVPVPVISRFEATPQEIGLDQRATLSWETSRADVLRLYAQSSGPGGEVEVDLGDADLDAGSVEVAPSLTTGYRLVVENDFGLAEARVEVAVPLRIVELTVTPGEVRGRGLVTVSWRLQGSTAAAFAVGDGPESPAPFGADGRGSAQLVVSAPTTVRMVAYAPGGVLATAERTVAGLPPQVVRFEASPAVLTQGREATLSWEVSPDVEALTLLATPDGGAQVEVPLGALEAEGSVVVRPQVGTRYVLTARNASGEASGEARVEVPLAIARMTVTPSSVGWGQSATVAWEVRGAVSGQLRVGDGPASSVDVGGDGTGSRTLVVTQDTTLTLTAQGPGEEEASRAVQVSLAAPQIESFVVSPASVTPGQRSRLSLRATGARSLTIYDEDGGEVAEDACVPGEACVLEVEVAPTVTREWTAVAESPHSSVQRRVTVEVPLRIRSFTLTPNPALYDEEAVLAWEVQGALYAELRAGGDPIDALLGPDGRGQLLIEPTGAGSVFLDVFGPGGTTATGEVVIALAPPRVDSFTVAQGTGLSGEATTLRWDVAGVQALTLEGVDSRGVESVVDIGQQLGFGSVVVSPVYSTTWTLTATSPGGSTSAQVARTITNEPRRAVVVRFEGATVVTAGEDVALVWETLDAGSLVLERLDAQGGVLERREVFGPDIAQGQESVLDVIEAQRWRLTVVGTDGVPVTREVSWTVQGDPRDVVLSEVLYDAVGADDQREWVELYNQGPVAVDLAQITVGYGGGSFAATKVRLPTFNLEPGGCVVVGGPLRDANNANPVYGATYRFNPNLQNAGPTGADGVALFVEPPASVLNTTAPYDAVVYGNSVAVADVFTGTNGQRITTPHVGEANTATTPRSLARVLGEERWFVNTAPTPGRCFGLQPQQSLTLNDQLFQGRRTGPTLGGNVVGLRTFGVVDAQNTEVIVGARSLVCTDTAQGLACTVPAGTGVADLTLRQEGGDVTYPSWYRYEAIDYCNVQFPSSVSGRAGVALPQTIYGRVYEAGVTDPPGVSAALVVQFGYGPAGSDPDLSTAWVFTNASYNMQFGNDDEYQLTPTVPQAGQYSYVFRARYAVDSAGWTYCDLDGTVNVDPQFNNFFSLAQMGSMTIAP